MPTATRTKRKAADAPAAPTQIFSAALAAKAREQREAITDFPLDATMPGAFAKVRIPDLGDPDVLMMLPDPLLRSILHVVNDVERKESGAPIDISQPDTVDLDAAKSAAKRNRALVDAYCMAGFVNPPLAYTDDDMLTPDHVLVADIAAADRTRFFNWCNGQQMEAAATVEPFPDGSPTGVATGGSGGVDDNAAEPVADAAGDGAE
jgi:hypothetical protein